MRENEDKMEELESSLFSQRSSFRSNRGSVSVAFFFPPARFEEHVTRAFRRLPLAWTAQVYARFLSFEKGVRVSKHTLRPLSDLTINNMSLLSSKTKKTLGGGKTSSRWENLSTDRQLLVFSLLTIVGLIGKSMSEHEKCAHAHHASPVR